MTTSAPYLGTRRAIWRAASAPSARIACVMPFRSVRPRPRPYLTSSRTLRKCRQRSEPLVRVSRSQTEIIRRVYAHHLCNKNLALPLPLAQKGASRRDLAIAVAEALFRYDIFGLAPRSLCGL